MRKPWYISFILVVMLLLSMNSKSEAALVTYEFEGVVNATAFQMRSPLDLFSVGDQINGLITFDNVTDKVTRIRYEIGTPGDFFSYEINDWTNRGTSVTRELPDTFIYAYKTSGPMDNWSLLYDNVDPSSGKNFTHNLDDNGGDVYNFNATISSVNAVPVPGAAWLLGSALLGLAGLGRRKKAAVA